MRRPITSLCVWDCILVAESAGSTRGETNKREIMAHIVAEPCFNCKYTDCVVVCPVECFYEGESMLVIHPDECIDCEACVPECPVEAIFHEDNLPEQWKDYIQLNKDMTSPDNQPPWPVITEKKMPLAGA